MKLLLRNPVRQGYAGWDDSLNRNRLLEVAADLEPDWIISIDADERLDPSDGAAVRELVEYEALPDHAYSFRVCRMVNDLNHYDLDRTWVCRLFPFRPGTSFSRDRLHFAAVPTSIHRSRSLKTTIRIQHLSGISADRRRARWEKYGEADPERRWQKSYDHLLHARCLETVGASPLRPSPLAEWPIQVRLLCGPLAGSGFVTSHDQYGRDFARDSLTRVASEH